MKRTLLAASVAVLLFAGFAEVLYAAPDLRREELLGQREVDFRADNDVIEVGRSEGRFSEDPRGRPRRSHRAPRHEGGLR
jgi:hypothetical protein